MADLDDLEHACLGLEPALTALRIPVRQWAEELPAHAEAAPAVLDVTVRLQDLEVNAVQVQEIARTAATSVRRWTGSISRGAGAVWSSVVPSLKPCPPGRPRGP